MRICSLLPSATDIAVALGLQDCLVAVTHECELPPGAGSVPIITRSTLGSGDRSSRDIHNHVTAAVHNGSSLYMLDQALLERCDPDLILTQELCEVCAISYEQVATAVHRLEATLPTKRTTLSLEPQTLADILETIVQVGEAAGVRARAVRLVDELRARIDVITTTAQAATITPRVLAMEWLDPPYTAGHWVPEMIRRAGGRDELGREGAFSYEITWGDVARYDPDVVILMPCSFTLERTLEEADAMTRRPSWPALAAVRAGRVFAVDGARYFSRHGPRVVDGLAILGEIIHPELFPRTSSADAWRRLS